jgi:plasmid replication initiation protein
MINAVKRDKAIRIISNDPYRIVKGNPIINAKYEISAIQAKIFLHMISKIDISQPNFQEITIGVQEFAKFANIDSKDLYKIVRTESVKLLDKKIAYEDEKITLDSVLLASVVYNKKQGTYTFEFPKKLAPFLLQLKDNFTAYDLHNVLALESAYSIRFFEFCKQFEKIGKFTFQVEELKEVFGIKDKYKNYFDFKKKVIVQAEKELKEQCELYFTFKEIKQGKKIVELLFTIKKNSLKNSPEKAFNLVLPQNQKEEDVRIGEIFNMISEYVTKDTVEKWFINYPFEQIKAGVIYSINENKAGKVKEMPRYLQSMVKTPSLVKEVAKIRQIQKQKKEQKELAEKEKENTAYLSLEKDKFLAQFYAAQNEQIIKMTEKKPTLHTEILKSLELEYKSDKKTFLTELAFNNYKSFSETTSKSKEEFLLNFTQDGSAFNSYVLMFIKDKYPIEFEQCKKPFLKRAKELSINID